MAEEKTLITHAVTGKARFLNMKSESYETMRKDTNGNRKHENIPAVSQQENSARLSIPKDVTQKWKAHVVKRIRFSEPNS